MQRLLGGNSTIFFLVRVKCLTSGNRPQKEVTAAIENTIGVEYAPVCTEKCDDLEGDEIIKDTLVKTWVFPSQSELNLWRNSYSAAYLFRRHAGIISGSSKHQSARENV